MSEIVGKMKKSIKFALRQPGQAVASVINRLTVEPDVFWILSGSILAR